MPLKRNTRRYDHCLAAAGQTIDRPAWQARYLAVLFVCASFVCPASAADQRPVTGKPTSGVAKYDALINEFMDRIGATAATFALMRDGAIVHARGYGHADLQQNQPTRPHTPMRLASNSKPFTAAIIWQLIDEGKLTAETPVFRYLGIDPYNQLPGDKRLQQITVAQLLEHRGGWDRAITYDPMYSLPKIQQALRIDHTPRPQQIVAFMLAQPLQFTPGKKRIYSNFGYMTLGCVVEKATGQPFAKVLSRRIADPLECSDIAASATRDEDRHPGEVYYARGNRIPMEHRYASGGLIASAPSLCRFLEEYWITGRRRQPGERFHYIHFGSLPECTTCLMEQRPDGVNYAVVFNSRRNAHFSADNDLLRSSLLKIIDTPPADSDDVGD